MVKVLEVPETERERRKRDWSEYNENLVKRHVLTAYIEPSMFDSPENTHRRGRPRKYPDALFRFALIVRYLMDISYRGLEGLLISLFSGTNVSIPDYTTLYRRCNSIDIDILKEKWGFWKQLAKRGPITIAIDSSGIKVNAYSEWMRHKWGDNARQR